MARSLRHPLSPDHRSARKNPYKRVELRRQVKEFEKQYRKSNQDPIIHL